MVAPALEHPPLSAALAIFVKTPGLSPIKTRLAQAIGAAAAEELYRCAAAAVAAVARAAVAEGVDVTPYWAVAEPTTVAYPDWQEFPTLWQGHGELADRLEHVHNELRTRHEQVLLIGADAPQISSTHLAAALAALHDPVTTFTLGRARDGGFWLLGTRVKIPRHVWQSVHYSDSRTAAELAGALGTLGNVTYLSELTDVDTAHDFACLRRELAALTTPLPEQRAVSAWLDKFP